MSGNPPQTVQEILSPLSNYIVRLSDFTDKQEAGNGSYACVYKCRHRPTNRIVALKQMTREKLEGEHLKYFCREVSVLSRCRSPFLLQLLGFTATPPYCIVTDYVPRGTLYAVLHHTNGEPALSPTQKTIIAIGIARGLASLHRKDIVHRDLKSLNILLDEHLWPKICDFGISRFVDPERDVVTATEIGTPHWMAPELFDGKQYDWRVDIYAFGMILWEMLTESTPFKGKGGVQIGVAVTKGERPEIPMNCPKGLREMISLCWSHSVEDRPNSQLICKAFLSGTVFFRGSDMEKVRAAVEKFEYLQKNISPEQKAMYESGLNGLLVASAPHSGSMSQKEQDRDVPQRKVPPKTAGISSPGVKPWQSVDLPEPQKGPAHAPATGGIQPSVSVGPLPGVPPPDQSPSRAPLRLVEKTDAECFAILQEKDHPEFKAVFVQTAGKLTPEKAPQFFSIILSHFKSQMPLERFCFMLKGIASVLRSNPQFVEPFVQTPGWNGPFTYGKQFLTMIVDPLLHIACAVIPVKPECISRRMIENLLTILPGNELKMLTILTSYRSLNAPHALDAYILFAGHSDSFLPNKDLAVQYLDLMYKMFQAQPDGFAQVCKSVFLKALPSDNPPVVQWAYRGLCNMTCRQDEVPMDLMVKHMSTREYAGLAISLLARLGDVPVSMELANRLMENSKHELSGYLLMKMAEKPDGVPVVMHNTEWLDAGRFPPSSQLSVFLLVFAHEKERAVLVADPRVPVMLNQSLLAGDDKTIRVIASALRKATITKEFVERLSASGFLKNFINAAFSSENQEVVRSGLFLFDALGRAHYVDDYILLVPYLRGIIATPNRNQIAAFSLVVVLISTREGMQAMARPLLQHGIPQLAASVQLTERPDLERYRPRFLQMCQASRS